MKNGWKETKEKGKKWIEEHKFVIGAVAGGVAVIGLSMIKNKITEPKVMAVQTAFDPNLKEDNFLIRICGRDRFGQESYHSLWAKFEFGDKDKVRIVRAIDGAINRDPENKDF